MRISTLDILLIIVIIVLSIIVFRLFSVDGFVPAEVATAYNESIPRHMSRKVSDFMACTIACPEGSFCDNVTGLCQNISPSWRNSDIEGYFS
jgi:hypothetical protein